MSVKQLLKNNKQWSQEIVKNQPELLTTLAKQQSPKYLWIGCSDSRVPANEVVGLMPGELFVHRNIANLVKYVDLNCQSVIQYAVDILNIKNIIICGHYGCGGVKVAMENTNSGISDYWLRSLKDHFWINQAKLNKIDNKKDRLDRMCELNVERQVSNLSRSKIVQKAWQQKKQLHIHGWVYNINNGLINDLKISRYGLKKEEDIYEPNIK